MSDKDTVNNILARAMRGSEEDYDRICLEFDQNEARLAACKAARGDVKQTPSGLAGLAALGYAECTQHFDVSDGPGAQAIRAKIIELHTQLDAVIAGGTG